VRTINSERGTVNRRKSSSFACAVTLATVLAAVAIARAQQPGRIDNAVREGASPYAIGLWGDLPSTSLM